MDDLKVSDKQLVSKEDILLIIQKGLADLNQKSESDFIDEQKNTFKIDPTDLEKIEKIVSKNNKFFANKDAFIREAIDMMSKFWDGPFDELDEKMKYMWKFLPQQTKSHIDQTSPEYYRQMEIIPMNAKQADKSFEEIQKKNIDVKNFLRQHKNLFKNLDIETSDKKIPTLIGRKPNSLLLHEDYARIFPTKLVLMLLAHEIYQAHNSTQATWISYKKFRESVYEDIRPFTLYIKNKEKEIFAKKSSNAIIKTRKISIGLPFVDPHGSIKNAIREKSSKNIFLDTYVGSTLRAWQKTVKRTNESFEDGQISETPSDSGYMTGILSDLNLIAFKQNLQDGFENDIDVTLTPEGYEFLMIKNPILDENNFERSLSIQEGEYYIDVLIQNHKLEKQIIHGILRRINEIHEKSNDSDDNTLSMVNRYLRSSQTEMKYYSIEDAEKEILLQLLEFHRKNNYNSEEKKFLDSKISKIHAYVKLNRIKMDEVEDYWMPGRGDLEEMEELSTNLIRDRMQGYGGMKEFEEWLHAYRISLMGRLSESGLVRWKIEGNESRYYSSKMTNV